VIALKQIVVATDFGEAAGAALNYGRDFARTFGATVHLVHVVDDLLSAPFAQGIAVDYGRLQADLERDGVDTLNALITDDDRRLGVTPVLLRSHSPATALLDFAAQVRADLIIIGTHGRSGLVDFFLGSVAQKVVRSAACPVLTIRHPEREFLHPDALATVRTQPARPAVTPAS
jgi:nucleotide-binding universal stress UspA family protein